MRTSLGLVAGLLAALLVAVPQSTADPYIPEGVAITVAQKEVMKRERLRGAIPPATWALLAGFVAGNLDTNVENVLPPFIQHLRADLWRQVGSAASATEQARLWHAEMP